MALPLETTIMREIGLGMHYAWFNGSMSCSYIAKEAARKLTEAISSPFVEWEEIVSPDHQLMHLAEQSACWDEQEYILTKAWQVISEIISAHIHAFHEPKKKQAQFLHNRMQKIIEYYAPPRQKENLLMVWEYYDKNHKEYGIYPEMFEDDDDDLH